MLGYMIVVQNFGIFSNFSPTCPPKTIPIISLVVSKRICRCFEEFCETIFPGFLIPHPLKNEIVTQSCGELVKNPRTEHILQNALMTFQKILLIEPQVQLKKKLLGFSAGITEWISQRIVKKKYWRKFPKHSLQDL